MIARLTRLARELGKTNVEVMANREADLSEWLDIQLEAASRGALSHEVLKDLRRVGIDMDEQTLSVEHHSKPEQAAVSADLTIRKSAGAEWLIHFASFLKQE